jgi:spermidine synthase
MDAAVYMAQHKNEFDVIIVDSSDPVGPAESLYTTGFYKNMHAALREGGIVCTQGECQWSNLELIKKVMGDAKAVYPTVDYAYTCIPTYPSGQIGFIIASKTGGDGTSLRSPRPVPEDMKPLLRYYSSEIHRAAFVLPNFAVEKLAGVRTAQAQGDGSKGSPSLLPLLAASVVSVALGWLLAKRK